ncbi:chitinase-like protein PB1E7.04c [Biomphalaria glabrata]
MFQLPLAQDMNQDFNDISLRQQKNIKERQRQQELNRMYGELMALDIPPYSESVPSLKPPARITLIRNAISHIQQLRSQEMLLDQYATLHQEEVSRLTVACHFLENKCQKIKCACPIMKYPHYVADHMQLNGQLTSMTDHIARPENAGPSWVTKGDSFTTSINDGINKSIGCHPYEEINAIGDVPDQSTNLNVPGPSKANRLITKRTNKGVKNVKASDNQLSLHFNYGHPIRKSGTGYENADSSSRGNNAGFDSGNSTTVDNAGFNSGNSTTVDNAGFNSGNSTTVDNGGFNFGNCTKGENGDTHSGSYAEDDKINSTKGYDEGYTYNNSILESDAGYDNSQHEMAVKANSNSSHDQNLHCVLSLTTNGKTNFITPASVVMSSSERSDSVSVKPTAVSLSQPAETRTTSVLTNNFKSPTLTSSGSETCMTQSLNEIVLPDATERTSLIRELPLTNTGMLTPDLTTAAAANTADTTQIMSRFLNDMTSTTRTDVTLPVATDMALSSATYLIASDSSYGTPTTTYITQPAVTCKILPTAAAITPTTSNLTSASSSMTISATGVTPAAACLTQTATGVTQPATYMIPSNATVITSAASDLTASSSITLSATNVTPAVIGFKPYAIGDTSSGAKDTISPAVSEVIRPMIYRKQSARQTKTNVSSHSRTTALAEITNIAKTSVAATQECLTIKATERLFPTDHMTSDANSPSVTPMKKFCAYHMTLPPVVRRGKSVAQRLIRSSTCMTSSSNTVANKTVLNNIELLTSRLTAPAVPQISAPSQAVYASPLTAIMTTQASTYVPAPHATSLGAAFMTSPLLAYFLSSSLSNMTVPTATKSVVHLVPCTTDMRTPVGMYLRSTEETFLYTSGSHFKTPTAKRRIAPKANLKTPDIDGKTPDNSNDQFQAACSSFTAQNVAIDQHHHQAAIHARNLWPGPFGICDSTSSMMESRGTQSYVTVETDMSSSLRDRMSHEIRLGNSIQSLSNVSLQMSRPSVQAHFPQHLSRPCLQENIAQQISLPSTQAKISQHMSMPHEKGHILKQMPWAHLHSKTSHQMSLPPASSNILRQMLFPNGQTRVSEHGSVPPVQPNFSAHMSMPPIQSNLSAHMSMPQVQSKFSAHMSMPPIQSNLSAHMSMPPIQSNLSAHMSMPPIQSNLSAHMSMPPIQSNLSAHMSKPPVQSNLSAHMSMPPVQSNLSANMSMSPVQSNLSQQRSVLPVQTNLSQQMSVPPVQENFSQQSSVPSVQANIPQKRSVPSVEANIPQKRSVLPVQTNIQQKRSVPSVEANIPQKRSVPPVQGNIPKKRSVPPVQANIPKERSVSSVETNIPQQRSVPPVQANIPKKRSVPSVQTNIQQKRSVPPVQANIPQKRSVPSVQANIPQKRSVPPVQANIPQKRSVPSVQANIPQKRSVPHVQANIPQQRSVPSVQANIPQKRSVPPVQSQSSQKETLQSKLTSKLTEPPVKRKKHSKTNTPVTSLTFESVLPLDSQQKKVIQSKKNSYLDMVWKTMLKDWFGHTDDSIKANKKFLLGFSESRMTKMIHEIQVSASTRAKETQLKITEPTFQMAVPPAHANVSQQLKMPSIQKNNSQQISVPPSQPKMSNNETSSTSQAVKTSQQASVQALLQHVTKPGQASLNLHQHLTFQHSPKKVTGKINAKPSNLISQSAHSNTVLTHTGQRSSLYLAHQRSDNEGLTLTYTSDLNMVLQNKFEEVLLYGDKCSFHHPNRSDQIKDPYSSSSIPQTSECQLVRGSMNGGLTVSNSQQTKVPQFDQISSTFDAKVKGPNSCTDDTDSAYSSTSPSINEEIDWQKIFDGLTSHSYNVVNNYLDTSIDLKVFETFDQ